MQARQTPDRRQLRRFGLTLALLFVAIFGLASPLLHHRASPHWPWIVGGVLAPWALIHPASLQYPWRFWMRLGAVLGWINSRILLTVVFVVVVTPLGLLLRLLRSSPIARRPDREATTYRTASLPRTSEQMKDPY